MDTSRGREERVAHFWLVEGFQFSEDETEEASSDFMKSEFAMAASSEIVFQSLFSEEKFVLPTKLTSIACILKFNIIY